MKEWIKELLSYWGMFVVGMTCFVLMESARPHMKGVIIVGGITLFSLSSIWTAMSYHLRRTN